MSKRKITIKIWRRLTKADFILILGLILANIAIFFWIQKAGHEAPRVIIEVDQKVVGIYDLTNSPKIISVKGFLGITKVEMNNGQVRMLSSPCPHQDCVKTGWISRQPQIICCLPNKVLIRISGQKNKGSHVIDDISR